MKNKRVISVVSVIFVLITGMGTYYTPFIKERLSFKIVHLEENTVVENTEFDIRFKLQGRCFLNGEVLNHLAYSDPYFYGYFICGEYTQYVSVQRNDDEYPDDGEIVFEEGRIRVIDLYEGEYRVLKILDATGEKMLILSSTKSGNQRNGIDILNKIKDSLEML